jgi:hypothetical protein
MDADPSLADLLAEVVAARSREEAQRHERGVRSVDLVEARSCTLAALERYAAAIAARSWPVPRSVVQDIAMHRALLRSRGRVGDR